MLFKFSIIFTVESFSPPSPTIGHLKERGTLLRNIVCTCVLHWTTCSIMQMFNLHLCKKKKLWIFFHIFVIFFLNCNSTFLLFFFYCYISGYIEGFIYRNCEWKKKEEIKIRLQSNVIVFFVWWRIESVWVLMHERKKYLHVLKKTQKPKTLFYNKFTYLKY